MSVAKYVGHAVGADQHVVLRLAELRGGEPHGALALDDVALLAQQRQHGAVGAALALQRALLEPAVVAHAHRLEVLADLLDHEADALVAELRVRGVALGAQERVAVLLADAGGDVEHVLAGVAVLGDLGLAAEELLVARVERAGEDADLRAGVVDVVLLLHLVARCAQYVGEGRADGRAAPVADVDGARGVGGDVLDLRLAAAADVERGPRLAGVGDDARLPGGPRGVEVEVEEAGRSDADLGDRGVRGHACAQRLGHIERLHAREALDAERQVGGEVAVFGALRVLEADIGRGERGQVAGVLRGGERLLDEFAQFVSDHSGDSLSRGAVGVRIGGRRRPRAASARWYGAGAGTLCNMDRNEPVLRVSDHVQRAAFAEPLDTVDDAFVKVARWARSPSRPSSPSTRRCATSPARPACPPLRHES